MISGIFHEGSGLGDQLFRYITVRTLAEEKGYEWGMKEWWNYKAQDWLELDTGKPFQNYPFENSWQEKDVRDANGLDIRSYDPEINFVEDNTIIDGSFEDDKYWGHNMYNISKWLAVEPLNVPEGLCVIGFRGGEYALDMNLFLDASYWKKAREVMGIKYWQVHSDDPELASLCFPGAEIVPNSKISHSKHSNMSFNWRSARYAKYAIIPNSAFFILPRLLKHYEDPTAVTIAPRYWARRNTKVWARPACYYRPFTYV